MALAQELDAVAGGGAPRRAVQVHAQDVGLADQPRIVGKQALQHLRRSPVLAAGIWQPLVLGQERLDLCVGERGGLGVGVADGEADAFRETIIPSLGALW